MNRWTRHNRVWMERGEPCRVAPVQIGYGEGEIPWEVSAEAWKEYDAQGHGSQSHERIVERKGWGASEMAILLYERIKRLEAAPPETEDPRGERFGEAAAVRRWQKYGGAAPRAEKEGPRDAARLATEWDVQAATYDVQSEMPTKNDDERRTALAKLIAAITLRDCAKALRSLAAPLPGDGREPAKALRDVRVLLATSPVPCPGERCPMCSGEACAKCGAGLTQYGQPGGVPCEHDVIERHADVPSEGTEAPAPTKDEDAIREWLATPQDPDAPIGARASPEDPAPNHGKDGA